MLLFEQKSQRNSNEQQSLRRLQNDMQDEKLKQLNDDTCEITFKMLSGILQILMSPKIGPYKQNNFLFFLDFRINYPYSPPKIKVESDITHPNIDKRTQLFYLQLLEPYYWRPIYDLTDIIKAMRQTLVYIDFTNIPNETNCLLIAEKILQQNQTQDEFELDFIHFEISENFKINFELNSNQVFDEDNVLQKDQQKYSNFSQEPKTINLIKTQRHGQNQRMVCIKLKI
ncbi:unnamed protein product [Paramecium pentaurelia]|uniref:UBC core domain-containing protein n=1 Tax=Paramecium pentaurelia TaxID=43138 RepID=A0A8S1SZW7_9CILI|nr:unnamed protein product [Paramecium pentaurelia]